MHAVNAAASDVKLSTIRGTPGSRPDRASGSYKYRDFDKIRD